MDPNSKKNLLPLNERLQTRLQFDMHGDPRDRAAVKAAALVPTKDRRPRSGFMTTLMKEYRHNLEEHYQKFCNQQFQDHDLTSPEEFAILSETQLLMLLGDSYNPKNFDFEDEKVF